MKNISYFSVIVPNCPWKVDLDVEDSRGFLVEPLWRPPWRLLGGAYLHAHSWLNEQWAEVWLHSGLGRKTRISPRTATTTELLRRGAISTFCKNEESTFEKWKINSSFTRVQKIYPSTPADFLWSLFLSHANIRCEEPRDLPTVDARKTSRMTMNWCTNFFHYL